MTTSRRVPLGAALLSHPRVTPREREIVIHRMTARCGAEYEWGVHTTLLGRPLDFTDEHMWALARGDAFNPLWDQRERLLIRLADDIYCTTNLSAALWDELVKHWKNDQPLELVITAGWYRTVSLLVNVSGVELEEWAERFPSLARANGADGRRRRSNMLRTQPMRCSPRCVGGLPDSPQNDDRRKGSGRRVRSSCNDDLGIEIGRRKRDLDIRPHHRNGDTAMQPLA